MSKLYQPIKNNPYRLRDSVYRWTVTAIRDVGKVEAGYYDADYLQEYKPTSAVIEAVNTALREVPEEYRRVVFDNTAFETALPAGYRSKATTLEKAKFIYRVAELLGYPLGANKIITVTYDWR